MNKTILKFAVRYIFAASMWLATVGLATAFAWRMGAVTLTDTEKIMVSLIIAFGIVASMSTYALDGVI